MITLIKMLIAIVAATLISGCGSHRYYSEAKVYGDAIEAELIRQGICHDKPECSLNQMVFLDGDVWAIGGFHSGGVNVAVYRISNIAVAESLVERCHQIYSHSPRVPVSIVIYSNAHIDNLHPGISTVIKKAKFS